MQNGMTAETGCSNLCQPRSPKKKINKTKTNGKRNRQRSGYVLTKEKSDDKVPGLSRSVEGSSSLQDPPRSNLSSNASEEKGCDGAFCDIFNGLPVENDNGTFLAMASRNLRSLALYVLRSATEWLEQQKPRFKVINSVCAKLGHAYPIILTWTLYFGKLIFLRSMVWLDCSIGGLDSLLRLGTTSFLATVWSSILSIAAMVGFIKMLIIMVTATAMVVFIVIGLSILVMAAVALGIVWFYGSFWTTGLVSLFFLGPTFMFGYERVALLITTIYPMHCARCYVGWLGLLFRLNASSTPSDILIHFLKNNINDYKSNDPSEQARQT